MGIGTRNQVALDHFGSVSRS